MSTDTTRPALPRPDATPADCRHARAAFHTVFADVACRRHLSSDAKLLHGALVSMVRQRLEWTQAEIAERLGWGSRQKVWRAAAELVADGLLVIRRRGLGLPNEYLLVPTAEISAEDIAARAPRTTSDRAGHQDGRRPNAPARAFNSPKNNEKKTGYPGTQRDYLATREPGGTDYLATRYGRLSPRP